MVKKYHIFTITNQDIDNAIKESYKQLREQSESDVNFTEHKKLFNKTRREIREHPKTHYKNIIDQAVKEFASMQDQFDGTLFHVVQSYMIDNGKATVAKPTESKDVGMDL